MKPRNIKRVARAAKALVHGGYKEGRKTNDTDIIDLLTDLRHLCERQKLDFDNCNRIAGDHYEEER